MNAFRARAFAVVAPGFALLWAGAIGLRAGDGAQDQAATQTPAAGAEALAKQVYAIFKESCFECHGEGKESGLDLRTDASLQKGGSRGKVVVAHQPNASRLYKAVMHDGDLHMPDGGDQLPHSARETIRLWIEAGAPQTGWVDGPWRRSDAQLRTDLRLNEKEQADHVMLVDLVRNDLGRI